MTRAQAFLGVLGWPLSYTLSPPIHSAAFRAAGLDWVYLAWPVPPDLLSDAVAGLRSLGAVGANVTMPHKTTIVPLLDELGDDARAVGAVNTVQFSGGQAIGHNTDIEGFIRFVTEDAGFDPVGRSAVILGAGGAARAVVRGLGQAGAGAIKVVARDPDRAAEVAALADSGEPLPWDAANATASTCDLIVNATPLGAEGSEPLPQLDFAAGQTFVDLNYQPAAAALVDRARQAGAGAWGGLGMLVHQAAASFRLWTGQPPPLETMSAAALRAVSLHATGHALAEG